MTTINVQYRDATMIDAHMRPFERAFPTCLNPERLNKEVLAWVSHLHGAAPKSLRLSDATTDTPDVEVHTTGGEWIKLGELVFFA